MQVNIGRKGLLLIIVLDGSEDTKSFGICSLHFTPGHSFLFN